MRSAKPAVLAMLALLAGSALVPAVVAPAGETPRNAALARAASPYLRAHADDLVRWRPWGEAAFAEARRLKRPLFLSVGYLACYWCSVMKRESFMDAQVAALLNAHFVPVLVDREARPDIDALYLDITRMLQGVAGWPNNLFLLPDGRPFAAFGYVPRKELLRRLNEARRDWQQRPQLLRARAQKIAARYQQRLKTRPAAASFALSEAALRTAARGLAARFDPFFGGLDAIPKHFRVPQLLLLARAALVHEETQARDALLRTLHSIASAAVFDPLNGGFFRYATDAAWDEPHFEKMLPDQALLADALREGWRLTGDERLKEAALATLRFAIDELGREEGGFASALSAVGADGREGSHYLWTRTQLARLLTPAQLRLAEAHFATISDGALAGMMLPRWPAPDIDDDAVRRKLREVFEILRKARAQRKRPARDEKVVAAYNGLMIAALARAGVQWRRGCLVRRAAQAARFVLEEMRDARGGLARYWLDGRAHGRATLADHAQMIAALLALHDAQPAAGWLQAAEELAREAERRLHDAQKRRWWFAQGESGFMRLPPPPDGALPAADAALAQAFAALSARGGDRRWREHARAIIAARLKEALEDAAAHPSVLRVADVLLHGEDGTVRHGAGGKLAVRAMWRPAAARGKARELVIGLRLAPGWHVQAARPDDPNLVPTAVRLLRPPQGRLAQVRHPEPVRVRLAFSQTPLAVLKGLVRIDARYEGPQRVPLVLQLQAQACSDVICLAPEQLRLYLPPAAAR